MLQNCGVAVRGAYFEENRIFAIPWPSVLTASASECYFSTIQ